MINLTFVCGDLLVQAFFQALHMHSWGFALIQYFRNNTFATFHGWLLLSKSSFVCILKGYWHVEFDLPLYKVLWHKQEDSSPHASINNPVASPNECPCRLALL